MVWLVNDVAAFVVTAASEVYLAARVDASAEERTAVKSAVAGVALGMGSAVGIGATALAVNEAAQLALDEAGVAEDSPFRKIVENAANTAGTLASGGVNVTSLSKSIVKAAMDGLDAAGVEGAGQLGALSGVIQGDAEGINLQKSLKASVGPLTGAATGGVVAATQSDSSEDIFAGVQAGSQLGTKGGSIGMNLVDNSLREATIGAIDTSIGLGASIVLHERAKATNPNADFDQSLAIGTSFNGQDMVEEGAWDTQNPGPKTPDSHVPGITNGISASLQLSQWSTRALTHTEIDQKAQVEGPGAASENLRARSQGLNNIAGTVNQIDGDLSLYHTEGKSPFKSLFKNYPHLLNQEEES